MKRYKCIIVFILLFIISFNSMFIVLADNMEEIKISIDGLLLNTSQKALRIDNSIMLPLRSICEEIGYEVNWLSHEKAIEITGSDYYKVKIYMTQNVYTVNEMDIKYTTLFYLRDGTAYASMGFFEDLFKLNIEYHGRFGFIVISSKNNQEKYDCSISERDRLLWKNTIEKYLKDNLWTNEYAYDAAHILMVPMHAAFSQREDQWIIQIKNMFDRFAYEYKNNNENIVQSELNRLHFLYLASRYIVLCKESDNEELIPERLPYILNREIKRIWDEDPSWQWGRDPFLGGMKERIKWKLDTKEVKRSYYRSIIDEELFTIAIAADLITYDNAIKSRISDNNDFKYEIVENGYKILLQEGTFLEDGTWLFQRGVKYQHGDYAHAGNLEKVNGMKPSFIKDIASDTSHSHRFPLWINSLISAYSNIDPEKTDLLFSIKEGIEKQFINKVIVYPDSIYKGYRTTNYMDGRNGVYRWNYPTQGEGNGYGPYELSGTFNLGWWSFLDCDKIRNIYYQQSKMFPLSENIIQIYIGPNTSRIRHKLILLPDSYYNGLRELIIKLAYKI